MSGKIQEAFSDAAQTQVNPRPLIRLSKHIPNLLSQNFDALPFYQREALGKCQFGVKDPIVDLLLEA